MIYIAFIGSIFDGCVDIGNIYPACVLNGSLSGTYPVPSYGYRYFNIDASGVDATFSSGHKLQFLPGVVVTGIGTGVAYAVRFYSSSANNTRMFTGGDISKGIGIYNGSVKLSNNGGLKFYD